jgi:hypothetical protein
MALVRLLRCSDPSALAIQYLLLRILWPSALSRSRPPSLPLVALQPSLCPRSRLSRLPKFWFHAFQEFFAFAGRFRPSAPVPRPRSPFIFSSSDVVWTCSTRYHRCNLLPSIEVPLNATSTRPWEGSARCCQQRTMKPKKTPDP